MFRNPQDLLLLMGTEILKIDAPWAKKLTKTRVQFLMTPTVIKWYPYMHASRPEQTSLFQCLSLFFVYQWKIA